MMYFDNAATSFPKPRETVDAVNDFLTNIGGNPGRGGSPLSVDAARIVFEAREKLTAFVNGSHSERMIFTQNGTDSLNLAILGLLAEHDHVITTALEHNSVMRPLDHLAKTRHVSVTVIPCSPSGELDMAALKKAAGKRTKAVIVNHGSNVIGSVQPLSEIRAVIGETTLIVDACQTIGNIPIDVEKDCIDLLCFSCHKALFGIQGLGALYMRDGIDLTPLRFGGTGSRSESTEQPDMLPDKYESGTPNTPAIAGLLGGLTFIEATGQSNIAARKKAATRKVLEGLQRNGRVRVYGAPGNGERLPILLADIDGVEPSDVGYECNRAGICVRVGLHCSPVAHRTVGTFPRGAVRISPGYFTSDADVDRLLEVVNKIAAR